MGLGKWSTKALGEIGKKIGLGTKLTQTESQVVNRVVKYRQLIQTEMKKMGEKSTIQLGKNAAKKQIVKSNIKKGGLKFTGDVAPYVVAGTAYDKIYDRFNPQEQMMDFDKIDVNKISDANKQAALNVKFE